jgi:hypothetical protein
MRGFRKEAIEALHLQADGMEFASEMVIRAAQRRLRIAETPIDYYPNPPGRVPHLSSFRDGWRHLRFMLIWCPKYLFFIPGLIVLLGGSAIAALSLLGDVTVLRVHLGLSSAMFGSAMMLVGMQVIMFGVSAAIVNRRMGWTEPDRLSRWSGERFSLERGLIGGSLILLLGVALGLTVVVMLFNRATPASGIDLPLTRTAILAVFLSLFGLQTVFGAFYLSFLDVGRTLK